MEKLEVVKWIFIGLGVVTVFLIALRELIHVAESIGLADYIPAYADRKRKQEEEKLRKLFEMHHELLLQYEQNRVERLLDVIGIINKRYVANLRQAAEFIRAITIRSRTSYEQQLRDLCAEFAIDQNKVPGDKIILYSEVRFYIDFVRAAADAVFGGKLAEALQALIASRAKELKENPNDAINFDRIGVPIGGNFFLGLQIAERLRKPLVVILNQPRVYTDCFWMGQLNPGDKLVLVNDVVVTGRRLIQSAEIIRKQGCAEVQHIFVLVERKEFDARKVLAECPEPLYLHSMLQTNDAEIELLSVGKQSMLKHNRHDLPERMDV